MLQFKSLTCKMACDAALLNILDTYCDKLFILAVSSGFYENLCKLKQVDSHVMAETFDDSEAIDIYEDETKTKRIARLYFYELNGIYFLKEVSSNQYSYEKTYNSEDEESTELIIFIDL